jgi:hypothetical protein
MSVKSKTTSLIYQTQWTKREIRFQNLRDIDGSSDVRENGIHLLLSMLLLETPKKLLI